MIRCSGGSNPRTVATLAPVLDETKKSVNLHKHWDLTVTGRGHAHLHRFHIHDRVLLHPLLEVTEALLDGQKKNLNAAARTTKTI